MISHFFDLCSVPWIKFDQHPETFSDAIDVAGGKRPDFIAICDGGSIFVEVKHVGMSKTKGGMIAYIDKSDLSASKVTENMFGVPVFYHMIAHNMFDKKITTRLFGVVTTADFSEKITGNSQMIGAFIAKDNLIKIFLDEADTEIDFSDNDKITQQTSAR